MKSERYVPIVTNTGTVQLRIFITMNLCNTPDIVRVIRSRRLRWEVMWPECKMEGVLLKFEQVHVQERYL